MESLTLKRQKENSPSQAVMKEARIGPDTRLGREIDEYDSHSRMNVFILPFICFPPTIFGVLCEVRSAEAMPSIFSVREEQSQWLRPREKRATGSFRRVKRVWNSCPEHCEWKVVRTRKRTAENYGEPS